MSDDFFNHLNITDLEKSAENDPAIKYLVGAMYWFGESVNVNYDKAFKYFQASAVDNYVPAILFVAYLFKDGFEATQRLVDIYKGGVIEEETYIINKNKAIASKLFKKASDFGNAEAKEILQEIEKSS